MQDSWESYDEHPQTGHPSLAVSQSLFKATISVLDQGLDEAGMVLDVYKV